MTELEEIIDAHADAVLQARDAPTTAARVQAQEDADNEAIQAIKELYEQNQTSLA